MMSAALVFIGGLDTRLCSVVADRLWVWHRSPGSHSWFPSFANPSVLAFATWGWQRALKTILVRNGHGKDHLELVLADGVVSDLAEGADWILGSGAVIQPSCYPGQTLACSARGGPGSRTV